MDQQLDIHRDLVDKCRSGDRRAQYQLYQLYAKPMLGIGYRILGDRMEAEDVLQDCFIKAFQSLKKFRGESTFGAWMKRIVINASLNQVKKKKFIWEDLNEEKHGEEVEENAERVEYSVADIKKAMNELPDGYRIIFSLFMFEDMSHQEIAEQLSISVSTSKSQLSRAKNKLKEIIIENRSHGKG